MEERIISFVRHPMDFLDAVSTTGYSTRAAAAAAAASDAGMFHEYARTPGPLLAAVERVLA